MKAAYPTDHVEAAARPEHSPIGASSHSRWSQCPGSIRLSKGIKGQESAHALLGTAAHALAELCFKEKREKAGFYFGLRLSEGLGVDLPGSVDEDMTDAVQIYLDLVRSYTRQMNWDGGDLLMIEHKFDLSSQHPGLYGTADCVIYLAKTKHLLVFDYKHGSGIPVQVYSKGKPNTQLVYYGLGALLSTGLQVEKVTIGVVQPRCGHPDGPIRTHELSPLELLDFAADLVDEARATEDPNAPLLAGDHCRFCPAQAICPEVVNKALRVAQGEFDDLPVTTTAIALNEAPQAMPYDPAKLAEALVMAPLLKTWCEQVNKFAYAEAARGVHIPGFKLVAKRANRKWKDEMQAAEALAIYLPPKLLFKEPEIRSVKQIEDLLARDEKKVLAGLFAQESSGTTLAPEADKRPAVSVATADTEFELNDLFS